MIARKLYIPALFLAASPAAAQLPEPVRAMIEAALATGDAATVQAVLSVARTTNPEEGAAIDALMQQFHDLHETDPGLHEDRDKHVDLLNLTAVRLKYLTKIVHEIECA